MVMVFARGTEPPCINVELTGRGGEDCNVVIRTQDYGKRRDNTDVTISPLMGPGPTVGIGLRR